MGLVFGVGLYMGITQDLFAKKYAISIQREKESEIVVPFEFLSKEEMQTERNMSPRLCCNYICWGSHVQCCGEACCHA